MPCQTRYNSFNSHFYRILPKSDIVEIQTDDISNADKYPPFIIFDRYGEQEAKKMKQRDNVYYAQISNPENVFGYHIAYQNSPKVDLKNGQDYVIPYSKLQQKASLLLRQQHRQPVIQSIKKGTTTGKIKVIDRISFFDSELLQDIKEPTIIVTKYFHNNINNPNIKGIIYTSDDISGLSHMASQLRNLTDICCAVYDFEITEQLKNLDGENVEINVGDNSVQFEKTAKSSQARCYPKIEVPDLKYCNRVLLPDMYSSDLIGAKAVNLKRLDELSKSGKIGAIVPKSIALPWGYLEELLSKSNDGLYHDEILKEDMDSLRELLKNNGIEDSVMVRSAFNGEDLDNYSAAGIYESYPADSSESRDLYETIYYVAKSKSSKGAALSRKRYSIPDEKIKPAVIIQNLIQADYTFTLYTDDGSGDMRIELFSGDYINPKDIIQPHVFTYHKNNGSFTYDSIQMPYLSVTFDENMNVYKSDDITCDLSKDEKIFKLLHNLIQDALTIEDEFNHPQDIEGGFKDNVLYIWQTRNIV